MDSEKMSIKELFELPLQITSYGELTPNDGRKSFYGKARVWADNYGRTYLQSYDTVVTMIANEVVYRLWDGYSATTQRHIKAFIEDYAGASISKKQYGECEYIADLKEWLNERR